MLDKRVSVPMIAGIVFYGISVVLGFLCAMNTETILKVFSTVEYTENVYPFSLYFSVIVLVLYVGFYYIMKSCNGKNNRFLGIVMLVAYAIPALLGKIISFGEVIISGRKMGELYLATLSSVNTAITIVSAPFLAVASILIVVAIGRFGIIEDMKASDENITGDNIYFGG